MRDLFVLAADKNMEYALRGGLQRHQALGIRPITFDIRVHSGRDGGVRTTGVDMLALERDRYARLLLVLDFEGCGTKEATCLALEAQLDDDLSIKAGDHAKAIVIDPESDVWVWGSDNAVEEELGWSEDEGIRSWLTARGFAFGNDLKPMRPKEALEEVLQVLEKPRSSAIYQRLTSKISLARCSDPAFARLKQVLAGWFPARQPQ